MTLSLLEIEWEYLDRYELDWGHHPELGEVYVYADLEGFFWSFAGPTILDPGTWPKTSARSPTYRTLSEAKLEAQQALMVRDAARRLTDDESSAEGILTGLWPMGDT